MTVYVIHIEVQHGESSHIHGIYASEEKANAEVQRLESSLGSDMVVYTQPYEVEE